jgi:uncharacterized membrane protein YccC
VIVVLVGLLGWAGYAVFPASFAVGFAFITALVVFLLNALSPDTLGTAGARLIDTLVGGAIGLIAYAVWPTWSTVPARQALADLVAADAAYLDAILTALIQGRRVEEGEMRPLSRRARLARTGADSTVARSLSEPQTRRIDADESQGALVALRRLVQPAHVLRLDVEEDRPRPPLPGLEPLARALAGALASVEAQLRTRPDGHLRTHRDGGMPASAIPDLRARYLEFARTFPDDYAGDPDGLLAELDAIVDATNSLVESLGLAYGAGAAQEIGSPA